MQNHTRKVLFDTPLCLQWNALTLVMDAAQNQLMQLCSFTTICFSLQYWFMVTSSLQTTCILYNTFCNRQICCRLCSSSLLVMFVTPLTWPFSNIFRFEKNIQWGKTKEHQIDLQKISIISLMKFNLDGVKEWKGHFHFSACNITDSGRDKIATIRNSQTQLLV